jgi:hypothetical protein
MVGGRVVFMKGTGGGQLSLWVRRGYVHSARARTRRERKKEKKGKK